MANASITVSLYAKGEGVEGISGSSDIAAAWDDEKNVDAEGNKKTRFLFGDEINFIVYCEVDYEILTSIGEAVPSAPDGFEEFTEDLSFPVESTATTSKPIAAITGAPIWWGVGELPVLDFEKNVIKLIPVTTKRIGTLKITYTTPAHYHKLVNTAAPDGYDFDEDPGFPALIVAMTKPAPEVP